ncbi:MAG: hypothetical protein WBA35_00075, partial [Litorimonas sp.]
MTDLLPSFPTDGVVMTALSVSALLALVLLSRRAVARRFGPRAAYALWAMPVLRLFAPTLVLPAAWTQPVRVLFAASAEPAAVPTLVTLPSRA